ncbi:MAG: HAMP domain-containing sensor histidine kinase [Clostridiales bacterium]|nr:HAMP domain-containing sensor histidine kinase [Clostridiales bacterium]
MTIKRRLFYSNIAMAILPILSTIATVAIIAHAYFDIMGMERNISRHGEVTTEVEIRRAITTILMLMILTVLVFITNRALTRFIYKSIMSPLQTLTEGVHEIRDGNLDYRIEYNNKDEFAVICDDFNEMAVRLSDMVEQRLKDEQNRRELIAGISHDLRTPLTAIKAYLEGIEKGVADTKEKQNRYLGTMKQKTIDLEYIINQLFLFSKLDIGEFPMHLEEVNLTDELGEMVQSIREEYSQKGLTIILKEGKNAVYCNIDEVLFLNILHNILGNSVKYKDKEKIIAEIIVRNLGDYIKIVIEDNGPGVDESRIERLFDVFYRGDEARQNSHSGSGLGLAITAKIVERMGGTICAENVATGGLRIIITLPALERGSK